MAIALASALFALLPFFALGCQHGRTAQGPDFYAPVTMDPLRFDTLHPPLIIDTVFQVEGAGLNAVLYEAQRAGRHPTGIFLHGFAGNEKNQDLAQAMRRAGWNALIFHFRGSWGSGGEFSFVHILKDVREVLAAIRPRRTRDRMARRELCTLGGARSRQSGSRSLAGYTSASRGRPATLHL